MRGILAAAVLMTMTLTACGMTSVDSGRAGMTGTENSDPESTLRTRPPFEEAQQRYRVAVQDWAAQIASMSAGLTWRVKEDSWGGCTGGHANTPGVHAYIYIVFNGPIPDDAWPQALEVVQRGAAELGATDVTAAIDRPGDHHVLIDNSDGVAVEFGTKVAGVLSTKSDCRLRRADMPTDSP